MNNVIKTDQKEVFNILPNKLTFLLCVEVMSLNLCRTNTHLYTQTAGFPFLINSTLSAGPTEDIGTYFAFALQLLKERKHTVGALEMLMVSAGFTHRAALFPF